MWANRMSAWLCAAACVAVACWAGAVVEEDVASSVAVEPQAPMALTAISAANPVTRFLVVRMASLSLAVMPRVPPLGTDALEVL